MEVPPGSASACPSGQSGALPPAPLTVCVFAGARAGCRPGAAAAARAVGELLAARGHSLVYGAGGTGIMGAFAGAAGAAGAAITGVVPGFLAERERGTRGQGSAEQHLVITTDMFDRKRQMIEAADAFLALPGGMGTLDEITEVLSARVLGLHSKPCVLLDPDGLFGPLLALVERLAAEGFMDGLPAGALSVAGGAEEAVLRLEAFAPARAPVCARSAPAR
jgi:uncharacterized protein (TIGR00730 family)